MWWSKSDASHETAWRSIWQELDDLIEAHTPIHVMKHLDLAKASLEHPFQQSHLCDPEGRAQLATELRNALVSVRLESLDLEALLDWFASVHLPDRTTIQDIGYLPDEISAPPIEPPGLWEHLRAQLGDDSQASRAAARVLYLLARARAVREYQG